MAHFASILYFVIAIFTTVSCFHLQIPTKTVIVIHGILAKGEDMEDLKENIEIARPGTDVYLIDLYNNLKSLTPLWKQIDGIRDTVGAIMKSAKDGVTMIGFSQGGLVARGLIQTMDNHNVHTFIGLSSPLNGQYGKTSYLAKIPGTSLLSKHLNKIFYTRPGQSLSIANYWRDPHHLDQYRRYSRYLAPLNDETSAASKSRRFQDSWKRNFMKLEKVVLIGGPDDGVITPWQSALFGCYDQHENVLNMRDTEIYKRDSFGLRTLDGRDAIIECVVPGVEHVKWHGDQRAFKECIEPHI